MIAHAWLAWGPLAGLLAGAVAWLLLGPFASTPQGLASLEEAAQSVMTKPSLRPTAPVDKRPSAPSDHLLFAASVGPGAVAEIAVTLVGVAKGPRDQAALLAIDKASPVWLSVGKSIDGLTLIEVDASKALIDTPLGFRTISIDGTKDQGSATAAATTDRKGGRS